MYRTSKLIMAAAIAGSLGGCASLGDRAEPVQASIPLVNWGAVDQSVSVEMDTALWHQQDNPSLLRGALRLDAPQQLFGYNASYALDRKAVSLKNPEAELPAGTAVGQEAIGHGLGMQLPLFFSSAPLQLNLEDRYVGLVTADGTRPNETRVAKLAWTPAHLTLGVNWQETDVVPLDTLACAFDGHVRLPLTEPDAFKPQALELSARGCRVTAPARGYAQLPVQSWGAAWSRLGRTNLSSLRLTVLDPAPESSQEEHVELPTALEFDLSHTRPIGPYETRASVRLRRFAPDSALDTGLFWSAETRVTRRLRHLSLSASLTHAPDPLWFLRAGGMDQHRDEVALRVGFKPWITEALSTPKADMGLKLRWSEPVMLAQSAEGSLHWNFSLNW